MNTAKTAIITGVSREMGLGFETARQLIQKGYHVIITARNADSVTEIGKKLDPDQEKLSCYELDVTNDLSVNDFAKKLQLKFGTIDALINNAGAFFDAGAEPLSAEMEFIKQALDTNLLGAWRMCKATIPFLLKSEAGRIVNVSSGAGSFHDPVFGLFKHPNKVPVYAITKLALNGFTVKLSKQLEGSTVKVNSVCPGFVATYPGTADWGARPVSEGAAGIVWAATLPPDGPTGGFFRDGSPLEW